MLVATFGPTTGWAGKTITREGDVFTLQDHGPISAADVMAYDSQGQLVWANHGMRAWVGSKAKTPQAVTATVGAPASAPTATNAQPSTPVTTQAAGSRPGLSRWVIIGVVAGVAVLAVVAAIVFSGVLSGGGSSKGPVEGAHTWPKVFAGTWVADAAAGGPIKMTFNDGPGEAAKITMGMQANNSFALAFDRDTMTYEPTDGSASMPLTRTAETGYLQGDYVGNGNAMRSTVIYGDKQLNILLGYYGKTIANLKYMLSDDGKTLLLDDHGTDGLITLTRE